MSISNVVRKVLDNLSTQVDIIHYQGLVFRRLDAEMLGIISLRICVRGIITSSGISHLFFTVNSYLQYVPNTPQHC